MSASIKQDPAQFDDVLNVLTTLRDGWTAIASQGSAAATP